MPCSPIFHVRGGLIYSFLYSSPTRMFLVQTTVGVWLAVELHLLIPPQISWYLQVPLLATL